MKFKSKSEDLRNFVKLKDKETIQGIFRGELYEFRIHWADNRSTLCLGKDKCDLCKAGDKSKFRFRVNFITKDGPDYVAKVMEQGWTTYEILRALNEGDYPLENNVMKITRQGSGLHTSYTIIPAPGGTVTSDLEAKLNSVALNDLGHITEKETEPAEAYDAAIPF